MTGILVGAGAAVLLYNVVTFVVGAGVVALFILLVLRLVNGPKKRETVEVVYHETEDSKAIDMFAAALQRSQTLNTVCAGRAPSVNAGGVSDDYAEYLAQKLARRSS